MSDRLIRAATAAVVTAVAAFAAPFVAVCRRSDGESGTLKFTYSQRVEFRLAGGSSMTKGRVVALTALALIAGCAGSSPGTVRVHGIVLGGPSHPPVPTFTKAAR
jgi:hypothetical protein